MMKKYMLSPSLFVGDLLNLEENIRQAERAGADLLHIDIIDTTFSDFTALPPAVVPEIKKITGIPLDIHIMTAVPELYLERILPNCDGDFVTLHIETTKEFHWLASEIRQAGAKPGVTLNSTTPLCMIEEVLPVVDMLQIMMCDAARPMKLPTIRELVYDKVRRARALCQEKGYSDMVLQCDGGITFEMAQKLLQCGANSFVLGRDSVFAQQEPLEAKLRELQSLLDSAE